MDVEPPTSLIGQHLELDVGPVAHGGHCVARIGGVPGGRVVFVRHALPGERVRALVTEDGGRAFLRADAVEVLLAAADRVEPPCPHAGPGRCGGCDWQHATPSAQRGLKADVVREQFSRLAGLDVTVTVAELPGGPLHWRTRIGYSVDAAGHPGLLHHRSRAIERIESCPLGVSGVGDGAVLARTWPGEARVEAARGDGAEVAVLAQRPAPAGRRRPPARGRRPDRRPTPMPLRLVDGPQRLRHVVLGADGEPVEFEVDPASFWQVHPAAAQTFVDALLAELVPAVGERVLDLYAGAGLFTSVLARAVGPTGQVIGIESDRRAVGDAERNLAGLPWAQMRAGRVVASELAGLDLDPDLVVLDPPRAGAGADIMAAILGLAPRVVAYVACDPASLARDVRSALDQGWRLRGLRAYDAFPMTHHVECIAVLTRL